MLLTVNQDNAHTVLTVAGEIDLSTSDQLDAAVVEALAQETAHLTLDLSEVTFLDSSGLGVIVKALKRAKEGTIVFDVVAVNDRVIKVFKLTGLDSVLEIYPTLDAVPGQ